MVDPVGKVCFVITSRASWVRVKTAVEAARARDDLEVQLVVAASAVDHLKPELEHSGADFWVRSQVAGGTHSAMVHTTALTMTQLANAFEFMRPDIVVTMGDRHETMATAVAASYMNIPLAHVQGGEVTGSIDNKVRHSISMLADWHFPATTLAGTNLELLGIERERIFVTGCPSIDIAARAGSLDRYNSPHSIVVLYHPDTTRDDEFDNTANLMNAVRGFKPVVWIAPNTDGGSAEVRAMLDSAPSDRYDSNWSIRQHIQHDDFFDLLLKASVVVGNSSVGIRECSYLGIPVVDIGTRQRLRERGRNVIHVDGKVTKVIRDAVKAQAEHRRFKSDLLYGDGKAGISIAGHLAEIVHKVDIPALVG